MSEHFDFLIDEDETQIWEDAGWSYLVSKFAIAFKKGTGYSIYEVPWPLEDDISYERLIRCYDRAKSEMDAIGAPYADVPLVPVRFDFEETSGMQWLGAYVRFFNDNLNMILINAWFCDQLANDDDVVAILMHELLHAGLDGVEDIEFKNKHGRLWYHWAYALEAEYGYQSIYDPIA